MTDLEEFIAAFRVAAPQLAPAIDQAKAAMLTQRQARFAEVQVRFEAANQRAVRPLAPSDEIA